MNPVKPLSYRKVSIDDSFWTPWIETNRKTSIPYQLEQIRKTGRIDAWKLNWKEGMPNKPHIFWDSDLAKWIEAASFSLGKNPDKKLEKSVNDIVEIISGAQEKDGYLNSYFSGVEPEKRWTNLRDRHELYCAGHLIEAAVANYEATGNDRLLKTISKYVDHIDSVFGREEGKKRGYPGHEEIELALIKLFRTSGCEKHLNLAKYFVDERGVKPSYFDVEAKLRGDKEQPGVLFYYQADKPVREMSEPYGHAVRAVYLYSAMADLALETRDEALKKACLRIWDSLVTKRMYITGGIGSSKDGERFAADYLLPNESAYAETCASIGLVFWAHRMLHLDMDGRFADVMEQALYNGALGGVSVDGMHYYYANPLDVPPQRDFIPGYHSQGFKDVREKWFGCSCCPPNVARLIASLGNYAYSSSDSEIWVNMYLGGEAEFQIGKQKVNIFQRSRYPWEGKILILPVVERSAKFAINLRVPGWCRKWTLKINGKLARFPIKKGYIEICRQWTEDDRIELSLDMPVETVESNPNLYSNCGKMAIMRGPIVYCLEEVDNGKNLHDIRIDPSPEFKVTFQEKFPGGGAAVITANALRRNISEWNGKLYRPATSSLKKIKIKAVPFHLRMNRKPGEMIVWIHGFSGK